MSKNDALGKCRRRTRGLMADPLPLWLLATCRPVHEQKYGGSLTHSYMRYYIPIHHTCRMFGRRTMGLAGGLASEKL